MENLVSFYNYFCFFSIGIFVLFTGSLLLEIFKKKGKFVENDPEKAKKWITKSLDKAKNYVFIVSGHAHTTVYNSEEVMQAFRTISKRIGKSNIKIVAGPTVYLDKEGKNGLIELAKESTITLYCSNTPTKDQHHYRCIDWELYDELPHPAHVDNRKAWIYKHNINKILKFRKEFEVLLENSTQDISKFKTEPQPITSCS